MILSVVDRVGVIYQQGIYDGVAHACLFFRRKIDCETIIDPQLKNTSTQAIMSLFHRYC